MKRSTTGRFLTSWEGEPKKRFNLSLTETAWSALDAFAETENQSRSEVIERYARSLQSDTCALHVQQLAQQVQEQAKTLDAILACSTDHIYVFDREGRYRYVSDGGAQVMGFQPSDIIGKSWRELGLPSQVMEPVDAQREQVMATGQPLRTETTFETTASIRYYEYVLTPLQESDPSATAAAVVVISRDISDRQQAAESLQRYRLLSEHSRDIVLYLHATGQIIEANQAALQTYGYDRTELLALPIAALRAPQTQALLAGQIERTGERGILFESIHRRKDGSEFPVEVSARSTTVNGEKVIVSIIRDITERKQAEAEREQLLVKERHARTQMEQVQRQLSTIFETSPVGIGFLDRDQRFVAINEALAEINGLSRKQHLGHTIPELFSQSDPALVALFQRLYTTGEPFISSQFAVNVPGRDDRSPGYYNVHYLPTANQTAQVEGVLVYVVDITARVRLEQAQRYLADASSLLSSSLDYQTTLERVAELSVPDLADWCTVHMVEDDGSIEQIAVAHVDPAKLEWADQLRQKYPLNLDSPRGAAFTLRTGQSDLLPEIPDALLVQAAYDAEHLAILREVGFKAVMTVPLRTQDQILGAISFVAAESGRRYDQMDLMLAEELARRASLSIANARLYRAAQRDRAQAEAANRVKDEFLAVLSHELRTPLNPILGWARILRTNHRLDANKQAIALETIERNARLQAQLIEDLLDISRILQGKLSLHTSPVDLTTIITAAINTVQLAADAKAMQINLKLDDNVGYVMGDPNRLQQVIWNLLSNAIKFTPDGGRVDVRLERVERSGNQAVSEATQQAERLSPVAATACYLPPITAYAQITVSDTGKGIGADFLPYVFESFRQADGKTTRQFGGLGLGLSIARHLVELHGGTIAAYSVGEAQGATLVVQFPLMAIHPERELTQAQVIPPLSLQALRVLVVDDDTDNLDLLTFVLEQHGAIVTALTAASDALATIPRFQPAIVLSDIGMPDIDGYMFLRQLRSLPSPQGQIPAIALTAYASEYDQQQALAAGFQCHLAKPIDTTTLLTAIASLVSNEPE